jgi:hypothetical protein
LLLSLVAIVDPLPKECRPTPAGAIGGKLRPDVIGKKPGGNTDGGGEG